MRRHNQSKKQYKKRTSSLPTDESTVSSSESETEPESEDSDAQSHLLADWDEWMGASSDVTS